MANDESAQIKAIFEKGPEAAPPPEGPAAKLLVERREGHGPDAAHVRVRLPGLSRRAYEHPADRAAMAALRKVPGFDTILRKFVGVIGERRLRFLYLASAVRVSERQFSEVHRVYRECCEILGMERVPELFIAQTPIVNAGAVGVDEPFIVLNSGTVDLLGSDELRFVLGHELGHVLSDHVLYKTMLRILLGFSIARLGIPLGQMAVFALIAALKEWDRKSELSSDRAGLLCLQDPPLAYRIQMKMAGGGQVKQMDIKSFLEQAEEYERGGDVRDSALKLLNLLGQTHPFPVLRLAELKKWVDGGGYSEILNGKYPRRDADDAARVYDEVAEGARSYRQSLAGSADPLLKFANEMWEGVKGVFGGKKDAAE